MAVHLGTVYGLLFSGKLDENEVKNVNETHFIINADNGCTLGFGGDTEVKYADVLSGGERFTMVVRLIGGRDSRIAEPFIVFRNRDRNYPIRRVPDTVSRVAYSIGPNGWMDCTVMPKWISETFVVKPFSNNRRRILYVNNCSGHSSTLSLIQAANTINTEIKYFPPKATRLIQPCDSFMFQKIKRA